MNVDASYRSRHEGQDFHSASLQLHEATGLPVGYVKSSPEDDMRNAIDIWFDRYGIAVRGRTFSQSEYLKYGREITIRANELPKIVNGICTAIVYQCYDKDREPFAWTIVSCNQIRRWFLKNGVNLNDPYWCRKFAGTVTFIQPPGQNGFYVFNLDKLPDWILYRQENKQ